MCGRDDEAGASLQKKKKKSLCVRTPGVNFRYIPQFYECVPVFQVRMLSSVLVPGCMACLRMLL